MTLSSISAAVDAVKQGELVVVVDDDDRENEGDLILAAAKATTEKVAFMIRYTSGILCAPLTGARARALDLAPMVTNNPEPLGTAFTVSVDYRTGLTTGISAAERARTFLALTDPASRPSDFARPGHVFPLVSREGGVLRRSGHTEAATDLATLAGLPPIGVLSEVVNDDGSVKRLPELRKFADEFALPIISIDDLIEHRMCTEAFVTRIGEVTSPPALEGATGWIYQTRFEPMQHLVFVFGDVDGEDSVPCRIHHERPLQDPWGVEAGAPVWLSRTVDAFKRRGRGVLIYLRSPHIRGAEASDSTPVSGDPNGRLESHQSANLRMRRWREIGVGAQILRNLDIRRIDLIASRRMTYVGLTGFGIEIASTTMLD